MTIDAAAIDVRYRMRIRDCRGGDRNEYDLRVVWYDIVCESDIAVGMSSASMI